MIRRLAAAVAIATYPVATAAAALAPWPHWRADARQCTRYPAAVHRPPTCWPTPRPWPHVDKLSTTQEDHPHG